MAGWHSLSGYLQYKCGTNALGRLITKRKVWCVLEESLCQLHYYKCEEDLHKHKATQGCIDLNGAAISLDLDNNNQFVILSDGKEHIFTAENHESMMIWLLGLQAKRDIHSRKINNATETNNKKEASTPTNTRDYELWSSRPSLFLTCDHNASADPCMTQSSKSTPSLSVSKKGFQWEKYELHKLGDSVDSGMLVYKRSLETSKSFPLRSVKLSGKKELNKSQSSSYGMLHHDSDSDDVFGERDTPGPLRKKSDVSYNWRKLQSAVIGHVINSNRLPIEPFNQGLMERRISSRSASSDSAIEKGEGTPQELSARLSELERELISTKCELAKVMNRQTCYQELLQHKEDTIKQLEVNTSQTNTTQPSDGGKQDDKKIKTSPVKQGKAEREFQEKIRVLQNQNRFLNEEVKKLAKIRLQEHGQFQEQNIKLLSLEAEIEKWKMDYVCLIQSSIRYPGEEGVEDLELCLYGGDKHKKRVQSLLDEARKINPRLPTYDSLANNEVHVDVYGFKHVYTNTGLLLHYLCTELTYHYLVQAGVYEEHQKLWTVFMRQHGKAPMKCVNDLKILCRGGIPDRFRRQIWRSLVHYKIRDIIKDKGDYYYRNLCNMLPESPLAACYRKQVSLDLMRTMPSNVNFSTSGSKGIMDLQDVLLAFCIHNPTIGYCQGMNFIVGMSLLFMEAEDAFWTLVAIAERYFSPHYFDHSLIGAQSDQQVLKDLVHDKLPALSTHLEGIDIELSTITLNWFLAVFFDAVPFQTLLRVWDCFLLEGPKVLFRFSLAILRLHERDILQKSDTMGIMRHLKSCAKLSYDVEGLVKLAFEGLKPFPKRRDIITKETCYLNALKEKHKKKELQRLAFAEREQLYMNMEAEAGVFMGIECAVAIQEGKIWVCYGDQHIGRLCYVSAEQGTMCSIDYKLDSRLMCMCTMGPEHLVLGTISWMLVALDVTNEEQVWQIQLHDAILSVCCYDDEDAMATRIFSGLADGTVAVTEKPYNRGEPNVDVMYIAIGQAPVTCLMLLGDQLWTASGNTVAVIHARTLDTMDTFSVSVNPYDHILSLVPSEYGIWISLRGSSILELWDPQTLNCRMLYDTRTDRYPQLRKEDDTYFNRARITSTLINGSSVWVGTGEGNLIIYEVVESTQLKTPTELSPTIETSSNTSCIHRPEQKRTICSAEVTKRLLNMYNTTPEEPNCTVGDQHTQKYTNTDHTRGQELYQDTSKESLNQDIQEVKPTFSLTRRRSSSENDMGLLQASRYASDGLATMDNNPEYIADNLAVSRKLHRLNSSENDLENLIKTRERLDSETAELAEEDELERELEAQARRDSLTKLMDGGVFEKIQREFKLRLTSTGSRSGIESGSSRRSSVEAVIAGQRNLTHRDIQKVKGDHLGNLANNRSDDSGNETRSRSTRQRTSESSSRRSSRSGRKTFIGKECDTDEDVFEEELEAQARRASLELNAIDLSGLKGLEVYQGMASGDSDGSLRLRTGAIQVNGVEVGNGYSSDALSDKSDAAVEIFNEERLESVARRNSIIALGITQDQLDESYLSSSPSVSETRDNYTPVQKQASGTNNQAFGKSDDSEEYSEDTESDKENYESEANKNIVSINNNANMSRNDGVQAKVIVDDQTGLYQKRRPSVIEDISVLCHDCQESGMRCSDCTKLLSSQQLLKVNERRLSLKDIGGDNSQDVKTIMSSSKINGFMKSVNSNNEDTNMYNDKVNGRNLPNGRYKETESENSQTSYNGAMKTNKDKLSNGVTDGAIVSHMNIETFVKKGEEIVNMIRHESQQILDKKGLFEQHTMNGKLDDQKVENENVKMFPEAKGKRDLTRQEKVGYWLSSIETSQSLSNSKDDCTMKGHRVQNGNHGSRGFKGDNNGQKSNSDSEDDMFYNAEESLMDNNTPERPNSLNLGKQGCHGNKRSNRVQKLLDNRSGSQESDGSTDMTRRSSSKSDIAVNKNDPGVQYRLDFSGVYVDTDSELDPATPLATPVEETNSLHSLAKMSQSDSRKNSLDLGTIAEKCTRLDKDFGMPIINIVGNSGSERSSESHGKQSERQRIFEFLKTPSLASRHMSLGLKIIEDDMEWTELYSTQYSTPSPTSSTEKRFADFLRTPSISSKASSLWSSYENISTPSQAGVPDNKLLRPTMLNKGHLSHSASTASIGSDNDLIYSVDLHLEAKVKISDKPVKWLLATSCKDEPIIMSFSGSYGDDEAVLKWRKHQNEQLWTNEPILELCPRTKTAILPSYMRRRLSSNSSFNSHGSGDSGATFLSSVSEHK